MIYAGYKSVATLVRVCTFLVHRSEKGGAFFIVKEVVFLNSKCCCFTGHRPEKLHISENEVKALLEQAITQAVEDGFLTFISGMARGVDIWASEVVLDLREDNPEIHLICTPPYNGFEKRWSLSDQRLYNDILENSDFVKFISQHYYKSCFQVRNVYMVNHSQRVISAYNGSSGGTRNTIYYANRKGVEVVNIFEN